MTIQPLNTLTQAVVDNAPPAPSPPKGKPVSTDKDLARKDSASSAQQKQPQHVDMNQMVEELNRIIQKLDVELSFSIDRDLDVVVAKVTKAGSDEVIRQIPSEEMLDLARRLREMEARGNTKGALVDSLQG